MLDVIRKHGSAEQEQDELANDCGTELGREQSIKKVKADDKDDGVIGDDAGGGILSERVSEEPERGRKKRRADQRKAIGIKLSVSEKIRKSVKSRSAIAADISRKNEERHGPYDDQYAVNPGSQHVS